MLNVTRITAFDSLRADRKFENNVSWSLVCESAPTESSIFIPLPELVDLASTVQRFAFEKKTLVEMSYVQVYTHEKVSERLFLPLGTVKSRIRKALQELRIVFCVAPMDIQLALA